MSEPPVLKKGIDSLLNIGGVGLKGLIGRSAGGFFYCQDYLIAVGINIDSTLNQPTNLTNQQPTYQPTNLPAN